MIEKIGKYEVVEKIGVGGFGTVYRGRDPFIKRTVAIKTCQSEDEEIKKRFFREAELSGNLHHRNITTIYDFGVEEGIPFIVQEYLTGEDLDRMIKRGGFIPLSRKIEILVDLCDGLTYAHAAGIIHRDMKPANVRILDDGAVKIMDFGIAKAFQSESSLTQTGITLGTAAYLAPEQIRGEGVDPRTDIFSLGVLAYELLTYQKPFRGEHISTVLFKILNEKPDPVSRPGLQLPTALEEAVTRAMEKDATKRYDSMASLRRDLTAILKDLQGGEPTGVTAKRPPRDSVTIPSMPRVPQPPPPATQHITPPSGMLARSSSRFPVPEDPTPTPRPVSLELVDFRNPSASQPVISSHLSPAFSIREQKSRTPLFLGILLLVAAGIGGYAYFEANRPAASAPAPAPAREAERAPAPQPPAPETKPAAPLPATEEAAAAPSATVPPAVETPPAPPRWYAVTFTTQPSSQLFIDGRPFGETVPKKVVKLDEGKHSYRFEMEDGESFEDRLTVGPGQRASVYHRWPVGSLLVTAGPAWVGANVLIDGKRRGRIPVRGYLLISPGAHEIAISKDGLPPYLKTVRIEENKRQEFAVPPPERIS
jgi:serine/threonine-protein kinase